MTHVTNGIRRILNDHARLSVDAASISGSADLFDAGMTSFGSVQLMMAIEEEFDIEFPNSLLTRKTFATLGGLISAVEQLVSEKV